MRAYVSVHMDVCAVSVDFYPKQALKWTVFLISLCEEARGSEEWEQSLLGILLSGHIFFR